MRKSRLLSLMGRRSAAAAGPVRTLKRQPVPEALEPRCLMAATGLSATGTSLHEKFDRSFSADVANFTATGTQLSARSFAATIDWSDGVTSKGTIVLENKAHHKFEVKGTHKFTDGVSNPTVTVTITALRAGPSALSTRAGTLAAGPNATVTTPVAVKGAPFTIVPISVQTIQGTPFSGPIAELQVDGKADFQATITYPDGSTQAASYDSVTGAVILNGSHTFDTATPPGQTETAVITVQGDEDNPYSPGEPYKPFDFDFNIQTPVTVTELPLTPYAPSGPPAFSGFANVPVITTFDCLDGYSHATISDYTGTVNWGDGTTAPLTSSNFVIIGQVNGQAEVQVTATHSYTAEKSYPITVTVYDVGGQSTVLNGTATVNSPASLQMINPGEVSVGPVPPTPPDGEIAYFDGVVGTTLSDYSFTIDWGDGTWSTTPDFYQPISNAGTLVDNHDYDYVGGDSPVPYTITVSVTGPGIDPANPLIVKDTIYVTQGGSFF